MSETEFSAEELLDPVIQRFIKTAERMREVEAAKSPEQKAAEAAQKKAEEKRAHDYQVEQIVDQAHIPKRHRLATTLTGPEWKESLSRISGRLGSGFIVALIGGRGTGKTQLGVELIRSQAEHYRRSRYCTAFEFFMEVKAGYNDDGETEKEVIHSFQKPSLLVIDELGKRSETEWENRLLYELLNRRYNDMKDTLIISNQDAATLESALGDSLVSRMVETGGIIECNWETYRK